MVSRIRKRSSLIYFQNLRKNHNKLSKPVKKFIETPKRKSNKVYKPTGKVSYGVKKFKLIKSSLVL